MGKLNAFIPSRLLRFFTSRWGLSIFCICLVIRVATIGSEPYWYDEAFTAYLSRLPFWSMLGAMAGDTHPPIMYTLSWVIAQATGSSSPVILRLPSALFSAIGSAELFRLVKRFSGNKAGMLASGLFSVLPAQIYYGQEARMYSLMSLLVLGMMNSVLSSNWLRTALCGCLLMFTHNLSILYVVPIGVWSILRSNGKIFRHAALGLSYAPWIPTLLYQTRQIQDNGFWIVNNTPGGMLYFLEYCTFYNRLPGWALFHGAVAASAVTIMALWALRQDLLSRRLWALPAMALLPTTELYAISQLWQPMMLDRILLPAGTVLLGVWAAGWIRMSPLNKKVSAALVVPMLAISLWGYATTSQRTDYKQFTDIIAENWEPGDTVYHNSISSVILFANKLPHDGYILPGIGDIAQNLSESTKKAMGISQREKSISELQAMGYRRVWVLRLLTPVSSQTEQEGIDGILKQYHTIKRYPVGSDLYVQFDIILINIDRRLLDDIPKNMLPLPAGDKIRKIP